MARCTVTEQAALRGAEMLCQGRNAFVSSPPASQSRAVGCRDAHMRDIVKGLPWSSDKMESCLSRTQDDTVYVSLQDGPQITMSSEGPWPVS